MVKSNNNAQVVVFGCGLSRTGNTSLLEALKLLGLNPTRFPIEPTIVPPYNAAVDITVIRYLNEFLTKYPQAKWILTIRNLEDWLKSCSFFFRRPLEYLTPEMKLFVLETRRIVYGSSDYDESLWSNTYESHYHRVKKLFSSAPHKLLVLDVTLGNPWPSLSSFLERPSPNIMFPHVNKSGTVYPFPGTRRDI